MQLLIWLVNSSVQNAFAASILGLVYGPVFPASLTLANDILPADICLVSMAIMWVFLLLPSPSITYQGVKIDLLTLVLEVVCIVALTLAGSNGLLSYTALFPFVAGLISSINGIHTLTFITVPLAGTVACLWFLFPSKIPHRIIIA